MKLTKNLLAIITFCGLANYSMAAGVAVGSSVNLKDDLFTKTSKYKDHLFIGGEIFGGYYDDNIIKYNYGIRATPGYKIDSFSVYGIGGIQRSSFANGKSSIYKRAISPLYGFGLGYDFAKSNIGIRINSAYFKLDRKDGGTDAFNMIDIGAVLFF